MVLFPPEWFQQWSQIIAGLGTVILTVFLVLLYKRQQEQLAANHEAVLEVTDVEWYGDKAIVWISNFGNGVAKDLLLSTLVYTDTGDHCKYITRSNSLKRIDKDREWTNLIQPGEEEIPFRGTSKIGKLAPYSFSKDWMSIPFSTFIRDMKEKGSEEVKFIHFVQGTELSGKKRHEKFTLTSRGFNPQKFDRSNSLGNLPGYTEYGTDEPFYRYFNEPTFWQQVRTYFYFYRVRFLNFVIPKYRVRYRPLDASGINRVKRVVLRRNIKHKFLKVKEFVVSIPFRIDGLR